MHIYKTAGSTWTHPSLSRLLVIFFLAAGSAFAAVQDLAGRYEGAWTNTTFGSTGKAVITIQISGTTANILFDMDGFVFGYIDPPLIAMPGTVSGNQILIANQGVGIFGDITGAIDAVAGTFTVILTNVPGGFIQKVDATGTIQSGRIALHYTVDFPGSPSATNPAYGVMVTTAAAPLMINRVYRDGDGLVLEWTGGQGPWQVQTRADMAAGQWANQGSSTTNTSSRITLGQAKAGFFRISGP